MAAAVAAIIGTPALQSHDLELALLHAERTANNVRFPFTRCFLGDDPPRTNCSRSQPLFHETRLSVMRSEEYITRIVTPALLLADLQKTKITFSEALGASAPPVVGPPVLNGLLDLLARELLADRSLHQL